MSTVADLAELSLDDIGSLLNDVRSRGEYGDYIKQFIDSGKLGVEVDFTDPLMVGKDADKAKIGFENAKKATIKDSDPVQLKIQGAGAVKVVKRNAGTKETPEWHLFLINTTKVAESQAA